MFKPENQRINHWRIVVQLSIYPLKNAAEIHGLTVEQLKSFDETDLNVFIKDGVLYTDLGHLGYVLGMVARHGDH